MLRLKWQQLPSQTNGFSSPWQQPGCSKQTHLPLLAQPTAPGSTIQEHHHIYFLQLRTLTNSSRQQRPVYLYFLQYIFLRMAVTIMEAIKKLALTLNKCAPLSGRPRKENLWGRCWIQGRKKGWIALARVAAQDAVANIWLNSLCSFRTRIRPPPTSGSDWLLVCPTASPKPSVSSQGPWVLGTNWVTVFALMLHEELSRVQLILWIYRQEKLLEKQLYSRLDTFCICFPWWKSCIITENLSYLLWHFRGWVH